MTTQLEALKSTPSIAHTFQTLSIIENLRLTQDFDELPVEQALVHVPIGKPAKSSFFRVHPDAEYTFDTLILERKETNETYLITPAISQLIPGLTRAVRLHLAVDRQGNPRLIPLPLPGADGRSNPWHLSLQNILQLGRQHWIRIQANMTANSYDAFKAPLQDAPIWPNKTMLELVEIAARGKIIDNENHPMIRELLGEDTL